MASDMFVAFGPATAQGHTLFGLNHFGTSREEVVLRSWLSKNHPPDETLKLAHMDVPQVRQTAAVLGLQPCGIWGLLQGCNEHQVALGVASWRCRRPMPPSGLRGPELVRLTLQRSHSARHAVDVLTDLISRHGHCDGATNAAAFLIADAGEAYLLEAAGPHWASLACHSARAVADIGLIRQDWQRLSPGLAEHAIAEGWWCDDGTKLDFMGSLGLTEPSDAWPLKRWGKGTLALAQQSGTLDASGLRQLLMRHFEATVRTHPAAPAQTRRQASVAACLDATHLGLVWTEAAGLWFPLVINAQLPDVWSTSPLGGWTQRTAAAAVSPVEIERLQEEFDHDAAEFSAEAGMLKARDERVALRRLAEAMMHKHVEEWTQAGKRRAAAPAARRRRVADEELVPFAFG